MNRADPLVSLPGSAKGCLSLCSNDPESLGCVVHPCVPRLRSPGSSLLHRRLSFMRLAAARGCAGSSPCRKLLLPFLLGCRTCRAARW